MGALSGLIPTSDIGTTTSANIPFSEHGFMEDFIKDMKSKTSGDEEEEIENIGRKFSLLSDKSLEEFRSDTLNDISSGLNVIASGIRVITTILSLFGADTVDR